MDKQRELTQLGWLDKFVIKNGSIVLSALAVVIPLYTQFVQMQSRMQELNNNVSVLTSTVHQLRDEIVSQQKEIALTSFRLKLLEQQQQTPRLLKP